MTTKLRVFDAALIVVAAWALILIMRVATGSYPPPWACLAILAGTVTAVTIGAAAGRQARR